MQFKYKQLFFNYEKKIEENPQEGNTIIYYYGITNVKLPIRESDKEKISRIILDIDYSDKHEDKSLFVFGMIKDEIGEYEDCLTEITLN